MSKEQSMMTDINKLPEFMKKISEKTIRKKEAEIVYLHTNLSRITKVISNSYEKDETQKYFQPRIVADISHSTFLIANIIKDPSKVSFSSYLKVLTDLVDEFETAMNANIPYFYNKKLHTHYKKVCNEILINTAAGAVINHCSAILSK